MGEFIIKDGILEAYTGREQEICVPEGVHTIGEGAFKACVSLERVVLPESLTCIGDHAFKGCRRLAGIRIPEGVSRIGCYAFHRCHALQKIALPSLVEELGDCVFLYCDSLTEIRMPGVRRFGRQVFVNDVLLDTVELSRELEEDSICDVFTGCGRIRTFRFADGECVQIPNAVEAVAGEPAIPSVVRTIAVDILRMMELDGRCLIRFLTNLKHVEIPEGIESLARSSFFDRRGILSVRFPVSLKEIGSRAFRNCIGLERVEFAGGQVQIHEDAFKNCTSLKQVETCDGAVYEFTGIQGIRNAEVPKLVRAIQKQVLGNFRISGTILLKYLGAESRVVVPEGVTRIAEEAFAGNEAVDRVLLPESVREIGAEAFRDCLLLQTIRLPEGLMRIGPRAFENCVKLIRIHLPAGVTRLEERTFRRCQVLREISFPEGFREIRESAFYGCPALGKVAFPESLVSIGRMAFFRCGSLKEVRLPAGTEQVGSLAFAGSGVRRVRVCGSGRGFGTDVFGGCERLGTVVLEEGFLHLPDKFAFGCTALTRAVLPKSLSSAGRHVWEGTPYLAACEDGQEGAVFWDGRRLEGEVRLPAHIRIVAGGAFYGNDRVTAVFLPESVTWIGPAAFKGCSRLRKAFLPSGMKKLEAEVFSGCRSLEEVAAGENKVYGTPGVPAWETVGERAFYQCENLKHISWEDLREAGREAFAGCRSLKCGEWKKAVRIGERALEGTGFLQDETGCPSIAGTIVVSGAGCVGVVQVPEGVTGIAPYAFAGNRRITGVLLPESLAAVGEGAFFGCSRLRSVRFPAGLQRIGSRAFERCISLQEIETSVRQAGAYAFAGCRSLRKAVLPGVSILGAYMFAYCGELQECVCGQAKAVQSFCFSGCGKLQGFSAGGLSVIRAYAFEGCESLRQVELKDGVYVGVHAFEDCSGITDIRLTGEEGKVCLAEYAFSGCTALQRAVLQGRTWTYQGYGDILSETLPETARLLLHSAYSCFEVEQEEELCGYRGAGRRVKIPHGIRRIRAEVFRDRLMLRDVDIPESVEYIGARAFHGTAWMEQRKKENPLVSVNHMLLDGSACQGEVTVPEDIRLVCGWAFANGMEIRRIRFLSDQVRVEEYAFRNCIFLEEMLLADGTLVTFTGLGDRNRELPPPAAQAAADSMNCFKTNEDGVLLLCTGNISRLRLAYGITAIGEGAFQDGNLLTEVMLPETVRSIGKCAFSGCRWLEEVRGARAVEQIGDRAFSGCSVLRRVELSEKLRRIGARAFENCTALEEILLPEGVEEIPAKAFYRCRSLRRVELPSTLKRIGREAFAFCRELSWIGVPDGAAVEERAFAGCRVRVRRADEVSETGKNRT